MSSTLTLRNSMGPKDKLTKLFWEKDETTINKLLPKMN